MPWLVSMTNGSTLSRFGEFTRSTSAPCSARVRPFVGPARIRVRSSTRTPSSGRAVPPTGSGADSPIFSISTRASAPTARPCACSAHSSARAHHRATSPRLCERVLERLRIPRCDTGGDCCGIGALGDAEHAPSRIGEPRERAVEVHPAPVAALVQRDQRIVRHSLRRLRVEHPLEHEAQQRRARPSGVDRDRLLDACLVAPDQRGRGRDRAERDCGRRCDGDRARVDRIAPLDRDGIGRRRPGARPQ